MKAETAVLICAERLVNTTEGEAGRAKIRHAEKRPREQLSASKMEAAGARLPRAPLAPGHYLFSAF